MRIDANIVAQLIIVCERILVLKSKFEKGDISESTFLFEKGILDAAYVGLSAKQNELLPSKFRKSNG
jgi:hypothetical protein